jgi:hypothetical protein
LSCGEPGGRPGYWPGGARGEGGVGLVCGFGGERAKAGVATAAAVAGLEGCGRERGGADTGGHWVATRRSLADRLVVPARLLLFGVGVERRGRLVGSVDSFDRGSGRGRRRSNGPGPDDKPFAISGAVVWGAWRRVGAAKGAPGVDGQDLERFEADLGGGLYRSWNRISSGPAFGPRVRAVVIPKPHGSAVRMLGVARIADRVGQTVGARHWGERADHRFHRDCYG